MRYWWFFVYINITVIFFTISEFGNKSWNIFLVSFDEGNENCYYSVEGTQWTKSLLSWKFMFRKKGHLLSPCEGSPLPSIFEIIFIFHHWVFLFSLLGSCFSALYFYLQLSAIFLTLIILFQLLSGTLETPGFISCYDYLAVFNKQNYISLWSHPLIQNKTTNTKLTCMSQILQKGWS